MEAEVSARWQQERQRNRNYKYPLLISGGIVLIIIGVWIGSWLFRSDGGYETNLYTEMLGIAVTVCILDIRARQREESRRKNELIAKLRSSVNSEALLAVEEIRRHPFWLTDGSLSNIDLSRANLQGANLSGAVMHHTNFQGANLKSVDFSHAHLEEANFARYQRIIPGITGSEVLISHTDLTRAYCLPG